MSFVSTNNLLTYYTFLILVSGRGEFLAYGNIQKRLLDRFLIDGTSHRFNIKLITFLLGTFYNVKNLGSLYTDMRSL